MIGNQLSGRDAHVEPSLPAYVNGTLDGAAAALVEDHVAACARCRAELDDWVAIRAATQDSVADTPAASRGVLDRAFAKIDEVEVAPRWYEKVLPSRVAGRSGRPLIPRAVAGGLVAAALAAVVVFSPVRSYAENLLDVFQPQQFVVVPVSMTDLESLPALNEYGTFTYTQGAKPREVASAAAAAAASGLTVLTPASLPSSVPTTVHYGVIPSYSASFTFNAAKAKAKAAAQGKAIPPMPSNIDGSSVHLTTGVSVVAVYGGDPQALKSAADKESSSSTGATNSATSAAKAAGNAGTSIPDLSMLPKLVILQSQAPVVTSNGVSAKDLEAYLLSQPGISPDLANAIRAIGDPTTTWPIPIPIGQATSHAVHVQGGPGTAIGDSSGLGSVVIWVKGGVVYAVGGTLPESDILNIANSLR